MRHRKNPSPIAVPRLLIALMLAALLMPPAAGSPATAQEPPPPIHEIGVAFGDHDPLQDYWTPQITSQAQAMPMPIGTGDDVAVELPVSLLEPEECVPGQDINGDVDPSSCDQDFLNSSVGSITPPTPMNHVPWEPQWIGQAPTSNGKYVWPWKVNGAVFLKNEGADQKQQICSGTSVSTWKYNPNTRVWEPGNRSLVWTAGHCLYDVCDGTFNSNLMFAPGYRRERKADGQIVEHFPYGQWFMRPGHVYAPAYRTVGPHDCQANEHNYSYDYGAFLVKTRKNAQGHTIHLGAKDYANAVGLTWNDRESTNRFYWAHGYPIAPTSDHNFNGRTLWQCFDFWTHNFNTPGTGPNSLGIGCGMWRGASGGGWFSPWNNNRAGPLRSNFSWTFAGGDPEDRPDVDRNYGPYYGTNVRDLWNLVRNQ